MYIGRRDKPSPADIAPWSGTFYAAARLPAAVKDKGEPRARVLREVEKAWADDLHFRGGRILGSMCTEPAAIAKRAHARFVEVNLGNPGYYPGTARLERQVVRWLADLLHGDGVDGFMVSGGTEANLTALWVARNTARKKEVLFPASAHFSVLKAIDLLDLKPVEVELDSEYRMDVADLRRKLSKDTCAVVAVAGTTELGQVDPIDEIGKLTRGRWFLHVDAAFGGFVLPFLDDPRVPPWDFRVPAVTSIGLDGHKMGLATIPSSALLLREPSHLWNIAHESPYLTRLKHTSLLGTRASAAVAGTYAVMRATGRAGYRRIVQRCLRITRYLLKEARALGFEPAVDPVMNLLVLRTSRAEEAAAALEARGWQTSVSRHPPGLRLVVMPHVSLARAKEFAADLRAVSEKLGLP